MKSVFFRRMLLVTMIVILLTATLVSAGFSMLSGRMYAAIKLEDMLPKAELIADLVLVRQQSEITFDALARVISSYMQASESAIIIFNSYGEDLFIDNLPESVDYEALQPRLEGYYTSILAGDKVSDSSIEADGMGRILAAGVPILDRYGSAVGGVLMLQQSTVAAESFKPMSTMLYLCVMAAVMVILILMTWQLGLVTDPLHKMSEVAIEMSKGNFEARASEGESGEIGLLARALNTLCENLSNTIYQLRSEKGQLDQLIQSLSDGVAAMDGGGQLTHYNSALMRMFGVINVEKREDLIQDPMVCKVFDEVFETGETQVITYPMSGDKVLWISVSPVTTPDGARTGVVGLFKDMTEMERTERMRREYVANVSHELRTPLTAVRGLLEPLADGMVKEEEDRQRYYKIMLHEVMRLSRLITDMMTLSRLQSGTEYMELARVDLQELISDLATGYASTAEQKGIKLEVDCAEVPCALTDGDRIEQVLVILLDNAMRYTPEGGHIRIRLRAGERLIVSVEDDGCGIPESDLPHIFERFYKVDKSRGEGGTGLGLSIAKYIMDKLGESITVASELGKGTCFTFTVMRYVSNAIELGPPCERMARTDDGPKTPQHEPGKEIYDADYEVVKAPDKVRKPIKFTGAKKASDQRRQ